MKWKESKSKYYYRKKDYKISRVVKCSGFYYYWNIKGDISWNGSNSWFAKIIIFYCNKNGKRFYDYGGHRWEIKKHNNSVWKAKEWVEFYIRNPIDYFDIIKDKQEVANVKTQGRGKR